MTGDRYILIITEKPTAMRKIAQSLAEGKSLKKRVSKRGVEYFEFIRDGKKHIAVCAVGHLFNLASNGYKWTYPIFDVIWKPSYLVRKSSEFSKKYLETIKELAKRASEVIIATDFDIEGSVIGYNILRYVFGLKNAKRMKFSTLTKDEIIHSYENVLPSLDFGQVEAGLTRHYLDWLWGINLTRALTLAIKSNGKKAFTILSTGRVQGPMLNLLSKREREIEKFVPKPFWEIKAYVKIKGKIFEAQFSKGRIWKKEEAKSLVDKCKGKVALIEKIEKRKYKQKPPTPFNTTDLQTEAFSIFRLPPPRTMEIAERLYQQGYISYPRSSSQKLPPSVGYEKIISSLSKIKAYKNFCLELLKNPLKPNEGKKEDPAHPCVYATHEIPELKKLSPQERKIYDLIARRTLAVFGKEALRESVKIHLSIGGLPFQLVGRRTVKEGWIKIYRPYVKIEEKQLPEVEEKEKIEVIKVELVQKETQPPDRFTQGSIIKEMEKRNLGTKATRSEILKILYQRGYIEGKSIKVTDLGKVVVKVLDKYCPKILSEELTRHFEKEMELIFNKKKKKETVFKEAKKVLEEILKEFKENEKKIGEELVKGLITLRKKASIIGRCPKCGGELRIIRSKRTSLFFVGCSNYPKCTNAYPIPRNAKIETTGRICERCNTPIIKIYRRGKRTFQMCLDPNCETKKDWNKKLKS